jgi:hypothetical protein
LNGKKKNFNLFSFKLITKNKISISDQFFYGISTFDNENFLLNLKKYGNYKEKKGLFSLIDLKKILFYKNLSVKDKKELKLNEDKIFFNFSMIFSSDLLSNKSKMKNCKCFNIFENINFNYLNKFLCEKKNITFNQIYYIIVGKYLKKKKYFSYFKKRDCEEDDIFLFEQKIIDPLHLGFSMSRILIKILDFFIQQSNNDIQSLKNLFESFKIKLENIEGETIDNLLKEDFNEKFFEIF